jgi:hypothetical protein
MVVGGAYNDITHRIELTLQNGNIVSFPVDELVNGLISSSEKGQPNGVASLDADGKVPKEQLPDDIGGGGETDYVKFTDYAGFYYDENTGRFIPTAGVIKVEYLDADFSVKDGFLKLVPSTTPNINQKLAQGAITPENMDKAWKVSATTNTETFTDEEKAKACETIGAVKAITNAYALQRVYAINTKGEQITVNMATTSSAAMGQSVAMYLQEGHGDTEANAWLVSKIPTKPYHTATKKFVEEYVDGKYAELLARIEALKNK